MRVMELVATCSGRTRSLTQRSLIADVFEENIQRLQDLYTNVSAVLLTHVVQKVDQHAVLEAITKHRRTVRDLKART